MRTIRFEPGLSSNARNDDIADLISIESSDLPGGHVATPPQVAANAASDAVEYAMAAGTVDLRGAFAGSILGRCADESCQETLEEECATNASLTEIVEQLLPAEPVLE